MFSSHSYELKDVHSPARYRLFSHLDYLREISLQLACLMGNEDMRISVSEERSGRHVAGKLALVARERYLTSKKEGLYNPVGVAWLESWAEPGHQQA